MVKYSEKGLKRMMEETKKDLKMESDMRNLHEKEVQRLRIILKFYEQKLREIKFKNPSSRIEG